MDLIVFNDEYDECDVESGGGLIRHNKNNKTIKVEKLFVAVGKDLRQHESLLLWAIQNCGGCLISVIHVHQPDEFIPILGKKHHWSSLNETQVRKYRGIEEQLMLKTLDEYLVICRQFGVEAEKLYIEMDSIEHGIMQLINCHNIEKLVVGAASDDSYHVKMTEPKSKKAVYLLQNAPASCHIWFICKGNLVHQREGPFHMRHCLENESSSNSQPLSVLGTGDKFGGSSQDPLLREEISHFGSRVYSHESRESTPHLELHTEIFGEPNHRHLFSPQAITQAKSFESLYVDELKKRKQLEEDLDRVTSDRNRLRGELRVARDQNLELEGKVANFDLVVKVLEDGICSNMELLKISEQERDDLKIERDSVLKTAEELLNQSAQASAEVVVPKFFTTLTFADIEEVTNDFNPSQQLWDGENGSIYRGVMSCTSVTVKIWRLEGVNGPQDFHREVEILSKFRHPTVVTVMGVSPDACALVYEYLPNGSLKDRLSCKDNTPSLSWKTRLKIATDLCSALIFLHSQAPQRVVHTTLSPTSVFLDSNFSCKIIDFGFSHLIPHHESPHYTDVSFYPQSSLLSGYMDPEFLITGEVNPAMDIYSFGMILLELLTGKPAATVTDELQVTPDENNLSSLLDASAGDWPFVQANQLAMLALRCRAENASERPDLELDVWRALDSMRSSCGASPSQNLGDEEHREAPSYFMCPIFQEVMKDPHIASDGYTYEAEALKGWLEAGHDTSPMTNLQLAHCNLVPNHALRSAIQEWRQQP
ncbi:hypothetical protein KSS87_003436 [Heliosperma pusillum]|nr:hypothetical protein KSS87_003436 [Heliosperma pusillum]